MPRSPIPERDPLLPASLRALACASLAACVTALPGCGSGTEATEQGPQDALNLVIVVLDTLRPDHLGCYGYARPTSPNLDRLAAEGVVFERALSAAPWTAPALISMVTSLYPAVHGVSSHPNPRRMADSVPTLAEILSGAGYATAAFTGGGYARGEYGLDQGFQTFEHQVQRPGGGRLPGDEPDQLQATVELSVDWLREHAAEPFFLLFHTYEPHTPYHPELEHLRALRPDYDPEAEVALLREAVARWNAGEELSDAQGITLVEHGYHCGFREADPQPRNQKDLFEELTARGLRARDAFLPEIGDFIKDLYDAEIRYADEQVQRVFDALEELELDERTIVAVVSDHGEAFGEHGELGHGANLHEPVLRIVMLLKAPSSLGLTGRVELPAGMVDLAPTVLELMKVSTDGLAFQGRSLVAAARGAGRAEPVFSSSRATSTKRSRQQTVRTERWRYIREDKTTERWLYDLDADPDEANNVVELHPEVARRLEDLLLAQRQRDRTLEATFGGERASVEMGPGLRAELEDLGYVGDDE